MCLAFFDHMTDCLIDVLIPISFVLFCFLIIISLWFATLTICFALTVFVCFFASMFNSFYDIVCKMTKYGNDSQYIAGFFYSIHNTHLSEYKLVFFFCFVLFHTQLDGYCLRYDFCSLMNYNVMTG